MSSKTGEARDTITAYLRRPWYVVVASGALAFIALTILVTEGRFISGAILFLTFAVLFTLLGVAQLLSVSTGALARLQSAASQLGGRYTVWIEGSGDFTGGPFAHGSRHARFGVLNAVIEGMPVEIGQLSTPTATAQAMPIEIRRAYVVIRIPARLPHMAIDIGRLSRFYGVRVFPEAWHRSQLVDVGGGRRFRLFVADDGEQLAREFFTPDMVSLFQNIGRDYDVEFKGTCVYLTTRRSAASGSEQRWQMQSTLIADLAAALRDSSIWEHLQRFHRGRGPVENDLRVDAKRVVIIVVSAAVIAVVVLSALALYARDLGLLKV